MKTAAGRYPRTAAAFLAAAGLLGCPTGDPPRPTINPGECWEQPASASHLQGDHCTPDVDVEPNGRLTSATPVEPEFITGTGEIAGSLGDGDDVDIFSVPGFGLKPSSSSPAEHPVLTFSADDASQLCAFFSCSYGVTSLEGVECSGTDAKPGADGGSSAVVPSHLDEGTLGCCRKGSGTMRVRVVCDNTAPQVSGFVVVDSVGEGCHGDLAYHVTMSLVDATSN